MLSLEPAIQSVALFWPVMSKISECALNHQGSCEILSTCAIVHEAIKVAGSIPYPAGFRHLSSGCRIVSLNTVE